MFTAKLVRFPGAGGWVFARIPAKHWDTSVWRDRKHGSMLAVPKRIRGAKDHPPEGSSYWGGSQKMKYWPSSGLQF